MMSKTLFRGKLCRRHKKVPTGAMNIISTRNNDIN